MRRQSFLWTYLVLALVLTIYGGYSVFTNLNSPKGVPVLGWVFLIAGSIMLVLFLGFFLHGLFRRKRNPVIEESAEAIEEPVSEATKDPELVLEESEPEMEEEREKRETEKPAERESHVPGSDVVYERGRSVRSFGGGSAYIRKVGYGPVLRVEEGEILDMRTNTYYRIEGNMVYQSGSGPVFEISGNHIRSAFGGYLYEISGDSVNKVFGGYYASISGNIIQTFDLSEKYEMSGSLNTKQKLAVVALLFGTY